MSELQIVIVERGYHVYVGAWKAAVGQLLLCKWEGGNIIDPYAVAIVENNDTPIDNDTPIIYKNICG